MKKIYILFLLILPALACTMSNQTRRATSTPSQESTIISANSLPEIDDKAPTLPTAAAACEVKTGIEGGTVNLRTCAGMSCSVLAIVTEGERLDILTAGESTENHPLWMKVTTARGVVGFINSKYCKGK